MIKLRYEDVCWSIPTLFGRDVQTFSLLNNLDFNNINYQLEAYGSTICPWNNGILDFLETSDTEFIKRTIDIYNLKNITPVLSFNKKDISIFDVRNKLCNEILEYAVSKNCKFVISSTRLFKYIKKKYPNAFCIASPIQAIFNFNNKKDYEKELKYYNNLLKDYDRIILRPEFVKSNLLNSINDLSKTEVIVNYLCPENCPSIKKHYETLEKNPDDKDKFLCHNNSSLSIAQQHSLFLSFEEIDSLKNQGIKHLKLLPVFISNNNMFFNSLINYIFESNTTNNILCENILNEMDSVQIFYKEEILKNAKINNKDIYKFF